MRFSDLFGAARKGKSVVLIDIGTGSVAGAYVCYTAGELPTIVYTRRLPIETRRGEALASAMLRALALLCDTLIREGAPALARFSGSGSVDTVYVSIDAPWQETSIRTEHFEQETPFVFTHSLIAEKLKGTTPAAEGQMLVDESIIGTILNGYETREPFGKRVRRASVIVLTSHLTEKVASKVVETLAAAYHTKAVVPIAGNSLRYQALELAFPHERDALLLDATSPLASVALIRKGLLVSIAEIPPTHVRSAAKWVEGVRSELTALAKHYPLPRNIFMLAREQEAADLRTMLDAANLANIWLSDDPPKIVSVLASHLAGRVRQLTTAAPDLLLLLMALFYEARLSED